MQPLTLSQLNSLVRQTIEMTMPDSFWVQAELAGVRENHGHCYMELIEKADENTIKAQSRACCWKNTWLRVGSKFERDTGSPLHAGMKVLLYVRANFHESFGFSWIVNDIDPTFTLGDMARRRQEILRILQEEGVMDLNKQLSVSPFCKRIAVISSATAAGYGDFCNQLIDNEYGFQFCTRLFAATMQGEHVEESVISALNKIYDERDAFDAVVIIRGGGSTTDLSGFDTLALAENVANFPLPVITGIGHDRDQSVLDIIACVSVKTPTAVAAFLIGNLAQTLDKLESATERITSIIRTKMETEKIHLQKIEQQLNICFAIRKIREENKLNEFRNRLTHLIKQKILIEQNKIMLIEQRIQAVDPINILKKGYSITLHDGLSVRQSSQLSRGDKITILFAQGIANATVQ